MGIPKMDARFAARVATGLSLTILGLAGLRGEAFAQYPQYYPPGPYTPIAPAYRPALPPPDQQQKRGQRAGDTLAQQGAHEQRARCQRRSPTEARVAGGLADFCE